MKFDNLDHAVTTVKDFLSTAKSVVGFEVREPVKGMVQEMASAIAAGDNTKVLERAGAIMSVGRSTLGKFIGHSVIDMASEGQVPKIARFRWQINDLIAKEYHQDIIDGLEAKFRALREAVRLETNGTFAQRVSAYNAMANAVKDAESLQMRRDRVRAVRAAAGFDKPKTIRRQTAVVEEMSPEVRAARAARAAELTALVQ